MRYRKLTPATATDPGGDYVFGQGGQNFYVNSPTMVAQEILTTLRLMQGEWYLNLQAGVPYYQQIIGYGTQGLYDEIIKSAVLGVPGVVSILAYNSQLNRVTRALTVTMTVQTAYGPATVTTPMN